MANFLVDRVYHLGAQRRSRPADKPMEILCLGLSRSNTDSLKSALETLGYGKVYHRSTITSRQRSDCVFWTPLMERKYANGKAFLSNIPFDKVLGDCAAVTDGPACIFGEELAAYYPGAKVILNQRRDYTAWYRDMIETSSEQFGWGMWMLSWFSIGLYWLWRTSQLVMQGYFDNDLEQNGKAYAKAHYIDLKDHLDDHKREYLEWCEEDGWAPLCQYLNKPVPDVPFPNQNIARGQSEDKDKSTEDDKPVVYDEMKDLMSTATRNLTIVMVAVGAVLWRYRIIVLQLIIKLLAHLSTSKIGENVYPDMEMM